MYRKAGTGNDLAIRALNLVTSVQAYGVYKVRPGNAFRAGEELAVYCEVLNFDCRQHENGGYLTALDVDVCIEEPAPAGGGETGIAWQRREIDKVRHYTVSEIRDLHLVVRFPVPAKLDPRQTYWLRLVIRDPISGKSATSSLLKLEIIK